MTEAQIFAWIQATPLGRLMATNPYIFSICESFHFLGLCLLLGALMVVDLRLLGFMKSMPMRIALKFIPFAIGGLMINLITGVCFFAFGPAGYWSNWMFKLKMTLVVLAGLNALYFQFFEEKRIRALPEGVDVDRVAKITATASLALWVLVLIAGRLLPVTQTTGTG